MSTENLVLDYHRLPLMAESRKTENEQFRKFLKQLPASGIETVFLPLAEKVTALIDCTACGNCCRHLEPGITDEEAGKLAALKGMSKEIFKADFTGNEPDSGVLFMNQVPCIFFDGSLCTIYENRPASCADFPHLSKGNFKFRFRSIMHLYAICPIVYNTVEQLKQALSFDPLAEDGMKNK